MRIAKYCAVVAMLMAVPAFGQIIKDDPSTYPSETIVNSPHNMNNFTGVDIDQNRVCLPCHTPHNALKAGEDNVLWNHAETGETFSMYSSAAGQPEGVSKLCLSCHDGVTAIDSYGTTTGTTLITSTANLGTDLSDDHPIGIEYPTSDSANYNDPSSFTGGIAGSLGVHLVEVGGIQRVECTSCHQVHNNGLGNFLNVPVIESYLCLQCHIK
ncbi:MAG: cytochrome C [bacterium]|nr:cytochrome C [bacterium]